MLPAGRLCGIKSERRLEEEVNYKIAYKWFCGLERTEKAPDSTTISQNRRRRFRDNNIEAGSYLAIIGIHEIVMRIVPWAVRKKRT